MENRLLGKREDLKSWRRAARRSVLGAKRGQAVLAVPPPAPPVRRTRARTIQEQLSQRLRERKERKAITVREVKKARPPFNNYISVKHTGFSPYKSFQQVTSRSKVPVWRAATSQPKRVVAPVNRKTAVQQRIPAAKLAPGVIQFPMRPADKLKVNNNLKVIPIALTGSRGPVNKPSPATRSIPPPKAPPAQQLPSTSRQPMKKTVMAAPPVKPAQLPLGPRKPTTENIVKKAVKKVPEKQKAPLPVEPTNRVLRSSKRFGTANVENIEPTSRDAQAGSKMPKLVKKSAPRTKPSAAADNQSSDSPQHSVTERTKGLEERGVRLTVETERLNQLAETWSALKARLSLPTNIVDEIDSTVGQTNLLIAKKFQQYKGLVDEAQKADKITFDDLDGFWEMMYMQVEQLDSKYRQLEEMKEKNWTTSSPKLFKNVQTRQTNVRKPTQVATKSHFRAFIERKNAEPCSRSGRKSRDVRTSSATSLESVEGPSAPIPGNVTPRAFENALRATRSMRFSNTIMRISSMFD